MKKGIRSKAAVAASEVFLLASVWMPRTHAQDMGHILTIGSAHSDVSQADIVLAQLDELKALGYGVFAIELPESLQGVFDASEYVRSPELRTTERGQEEYERLLMEVARTIKLDSFQIISEEDVGDPVRRALALAIRAHDLGFKVRFVDAERLVQPAMEGNNLSNDPCYLVDADARNTFIAKNLSDRAQDGLNVVFFGGANHTGYGDDPLACGGSTINSELIRMGVVNAALDFYTDRPAMLPSSYTEPLENAFQEADIVLDRPYNQSEFFDAAKSLSVRMEMISKENFKGEKSLIFIIRMQKNFTVLSL